MVSLLLGSVAHKVGLNKKLYFVWRLGSPALHIAFQVLTAGSESNRTVLQCVLLHELFLFLCLE